jgi:adenosine deaminase
VQELIGDRDDWARVAYESIVDAAPHGLRYREMFFTPARHLAAGQPLAEIVGRPDRGDRGGPARDRCACALICDIDRAYGGAAATELAEGSRQAASGRIRRFRHRPRHGFDGARRRSRDFAPAYNVARAAGLHATGHAGEDTGPENIAAALDALDLERIDHGIAIVEDAELMSRVAEARIPLDVCPTSNVVIANGSRRSRITRFDGCAKPDCW